MEKLHHIMNRNNVLLITSLFCTLGLFANNELNKDSLPKIDSVVFNLAADDPFVKHLDDLLSLHFQQPWRIEYDTVDFDSTHQLSELFIEPSDSLVEARLALLNSATPFDLTYNSKTKAFINLYALKKRDLTSRFVGLSEFYFPMIEEQLDKHEMPLELKHLAIVESALNSTARSRAGATGLWQFMYSTGKIYDLRVNSYIDDRKDPVKSTVAACKYLKYLHSIYDDWNLALAAYNCGPGNVNKAIRRSGGRKDYWEIYPYLPRETRGYVPAFIAVNYIMNHYEDYEIKPTPSSYSFFSCDTILVDKRISLAHLSEVLNLSEEDILHLNPQYKLGVIPDLEEKQVLRLPTEKLANFLNNESDIYEIYAQTVKSEPTIEVIPQYEVYRVKNGDYLGKIASRYNVSIRDLREWNNLRSDNLRIGQRLNIYHSGSVSNNRSVTAKKEMKTQTDGNYIYYEVQQGDTLWDIAKAKGISTSQLKSLNQDINEKRMKPGDKIIVGKNG